MKRKIKSPVVFVNYILLPLLLIVILGNALSTMFQPESKETAAAINITQTRTVVVNEDSGQFGKDIVAFLTSSENSELYEVTIAANAEEARKALEADEYDQFIYLPAGLTEGVTANRESTVTVYGKDQNIDKVDITALTLSAFGDGYQAMGVSGRDNQPLVYQHAYSNLLTAGGAAGEQGEAGGMSGLSYYGVTMLVLILFYGLANTMNFIQEEYNEALGDRYLISPVSKMSLVVSQWLTGCSISILQGLVIVACAKLFFNVSYGNNNLVVLFIIIVGAIFFNALGLFLGVLGRRMKALDSIVSLLIPVMTFIGGGFIKLDFGSLSRLSINEVFQQPLFNYIQQGVIDLMPVYNALVLSLGFVLISVFSLTRKGVR
jgi:ABC-2 type transport system permease protein